MVASSSIEMFLLYDRAVSEDFIKKPKHKEQLMRADVSNY